MQEFIDKLKKYVTTILHFDQKHFPPPITYSSALFTAVAPEISKGSQSLVEKVDQSSRLADPGDRTNLPNRSVTKRITPAHLLLVNHSMKQPGFGQLVSRLCTTGTRSTAIQLPPGRHCFRLFAEAPLGLGYVIRLLGRSRRRSDLSKIEVN
ncbi:unnamed protein product [Protopolystoma xenopodis]|uniref:Androglobin domain-containing protein n=1 Tax=Protopolystoma xenopodis TaxID=117903 RepID=A0A3S5AX62_9PLAT|nr:unnamed protein product [Protopolystoma xenopodis]